MKVGFYTLLLLTMILAAEVAWLDSKVINYECYQGSIKLCDELRNSMQYTYGPFGALGFFIVMIVWKYAERKIL